MAGLTEQWEAALDARLAMSPRSPVSVRPGGEAERCLSRRTGGHLRVLEAA